MKPKHPSPLLAGIAERTLRSLALAAVVAAAPVLAAQSAAGRADDVRRDVYLCGMDADIEELLARAIELQGKGDHATALDIYGKILSIRPNCYDVYQHMALSHGIAGDDRRFDACMRKAEKLKQDYERYAPKKGEAPPKTEKTRTVILKEPPKKERINYWKWLFIYSLIRR